MVLQGFSITLKLLVKTNSPGGVEQPYHKHVDVNKHAPCPHAGDNTPKTPTLRPCITRLTTATTTVQGAPVTVRQSRLHSLDGCRQRLAQAVGVEVLSLQQRRQQESQPAQQQRQTEAGVHCSTLRESCYGRQSCHGRMGDAWPSRKSRRPVLGLWEGWLHVGTVATASVASPTGVLHGDCAIERTPICRHCTCETPAMAGRMQWCPVWVAVSRHPPASAGV